MPENVTLHVAITISLGELQWLLFLLHFLGMAGNVVKNCQPVPILTRAL